MKRQIMSESGLKINNPLLEMGFKNENIIAKGEFGAVMARAGIGKTPVVVQLAIFSMIANKKVMHISLDEPVNKVNLWYKEMFHNIAEQSNIEMATAQWEKILPNRFIMTLQLDGFSVPRLKERLDDLSEQDIFTPETLVIDSFPFERCDKKTLTDLKALAEEMNINVWFTIKTHRHEKPNAEGLPVQLTGYSDLFNTLLQIMPEEDKIKVQLVKGDVIENSATQLIIDPSTMLVK
jgi:hypothetical protein